MKDGHGKADFNKASAKTLEKRSRHYTHSDLVQKLDRIAAIAKTKAQRDHILDMKEAYSGDKEKTVVNRFVRNKNFEMGKRAGLHHGKTLQGLERNDAANDQKRRNDTVRTAKEYYHKNFSPSKAFTKSAAKAKDKTIDRG